MAYFFPFDCWLVGSDFLDPVDSAWQCMSKICVVSTWGGDQKEQNLLVLRASRFEFFDFITRLSSLVSCVTVRFITSRLHKYVVLVFCLKEEGDGNAYMVGRKDSKKRKEVFILIVVNLLCCRAVFGFHAAHVVMLLGN